MTRLVLVALCALTSFFVSQSGRSAETAFEQQCANLSARKGDDAERLRELFNLAWEHTMRESPEFATEVGYPGQNDRWSDQSLEAIALRKRELQASMGVLQTIDRSKLNAADQLNYDLFKKNYEDAIEGTRFKVEYMAITQLSGVQQEAAEIMEISPRLSVKDYEDMLTRLKGVPTLVSQVMVLLNKGLETGITPPRITLRDVPLQIKEQMVEDPEKNALLKPFAEFPAEIVKRIHKEMEEVIQRTGFKGSQQEFFKFMRTDLQFYYRDAEGLLRGYRDIAKQVDPELTRLFGKLPRLPYGVKPVPAFSEKSQTTAYYQPGSVKAGRPGWFYANTYALDTRPKWEMMALTLHEAVPGHHLQISLAQEMEDAPEFRKHGSYTVFVEGWGLYAESLGGELGMYKNPYTKFGQLTYEMWRAIRLVVDTGMHAKGWSRKQAIDYFLTNAGKNEHDITVEVDRYIVWPGQALAYKIGELKLKELRAYAAKELGEKFDVRQFHDQVLDSGAVPMDVLESRIKEWVAGMK